jgi:hypothetical protein
MLSAEWLETVAPVGRFLPPGGWAAHGAGVFLHKPPLVWLVTANHVVNSIGEAAVSALVSRAAGGVTVVEVGTILAAHNFSWIRDEANDLAAAPMPVSDEVRIKALPAEFCLPFGSVIPSMTAYTIGCPYGLYGVNPQQATPLLLDGVIAGVNPISNRVYTSARTFPGNSGGPLVVVRSPFTPEGTMSVGRQTVLLAGVMLETVLLESPKTGDKTPPLHMGVAAPTDAILAMLDSAPARSIVAKLFPTLPPQPGAA